MEGGEVALLDCGQVGCNHGVEWSNHCWLIIEHAIYKSLHVGEANKHEATDQLGKLDNNGEPMGATKFETGAVEKSGKYIPRKQ